MKRIAIDRNLLIGILGLVVGILGVLVGYLAYKATWDAALESGSLAKSELSLGIEGIKIDHSSVTRLIFGIPNLSKEEFVSIGRLPFTVTNRGKKTVEEGTITFRYHNIGKRRVLQENLAFNASGSYHVSEMKRAVTNDYSFDYISYRFPLLDPGLNLRISEPLYLETTQVSDTVVARTADGKNVSFDVSVDYAVEFLVTTSAKGEQVRNYQMTWEAVEASSMEALQSYVLSTLFQTCVRSFAGSCLGDGTLLSWFFEIQSTMFS